MALAIEKVIDGAIKYIDLEIISGMNDWQELITRVMLGRLIGNNDALKTAIINNGIIRTFGIVDSDGMVDIETLANDIKREIARKGSLCVKIPIFGTMTFKPDDVDKLYNMIIGG